MDYSLLVAVERMSAAPSAKADSRRAWQCVVQEQGEAGTGSFSYATVHLGVIDILQVGGSHAQSALRPFLFLHFPLSLSLSLSLSLFLSLSFSLSLFLSLSRARTHARTRATHYRARIILRHPLPIRQLAGVRRLEEDRALLQVVGQGRRHRAQYLQRAPAAVRCALCIVHGRTHPGRPQ